MGRTPRGRGGGESEVPSAGHTRLGQARPPAGSTHPVPLQPGGQVRDRSGLPCSDMTPARRAGSGQVRVSLQ